MERPHDALPAEVIDALRRGARDRGDQAAARQGHHPGRREGAVEAHLRGFSTNRARRSRPAGRFRPTPRARSARGDKIEAIKLARAETGLGLKEGEDWVDAHAATPQMPTGLAPGEVPRHEGWGAWIVVIVLVVAAAYFVFLRDG
jgi:hypothetical protein